MAMPASEMIARTVEDEERMKKAGSSDCLEDGGARHGD
jgi:hypothetical protein